MGGIGPVSEGLFAWLVGIGSLVGVATWIAAHTARSSKQKAELMTRQPPGDHPRRPHAGRRRRSPSPTRVCRPTSGGPPTSTPRRRSAPSARSRACSCWPSSAPIGFIASYVVFKVGDNPDTIGNLGASNVALGVCLAVTLLGMGAGMIQWARKLMGDHEIVEMRHTASSPPEDREATIGILQVGLEESGLGRRPLIRNTLLAAGGILGLLPIVMLRDLGPLPGDKLDHTIWDTRHLDPRDAGVVEDAEPQPPARRPRRRRDADQGHRARDRRPGQRRARGHVRPRRRRPSSRSSRAPSCWSTSPRPR